MLRKCKVCKNNYPLDKKHFRIRGREKYNPNKFIYRWECLKCEKILSKKYRDDRRRIERRINKVEIRRFKNLDITKEELIKRKVNERIILKKYGITDKEFYDTFKKQDSKCAICNKELILFSKLKRLQPVIDHDHITKKFRGILCSNCNTGLGLLADSLVNLNNARVYLLKNGS